MVAVFNINFLWYTVIPSKHQLVRCETVVEVTRNAVPIKGLVPERRYGKSLKDLRLKFKSWQDLQQQSKVWKIAAFIECCLCVQLPTYSFLTVEVIGLIRDGIQNHVKAVLGKDGAVAHSAICMTRPKSKKNNFYETLFEVFLNCNFVVVLKL